MNRVTKLLAILSHQERNQAGWLLVMILIMALFDVLGVASIMPFMAVLANPSLIDTNDLLSLLYFRIGFNNKSEFLLFLGIIVFVLLVFSLAFKALTTYAQLRFTLMREFSIGRKLVAGYLHQPYTWFLNRNSADLGQTVLSEVGHVIYGAVIPMMTLLAQGVVVLALLTLLIVVDSILAMVVGAVLAGAYGFLYFLMSNFLSRIGCERVEANEGRFSAISEAFGAIKEVKAGGLEQTYIEYFSRPAELFAKHQASAQVVAQVPRFALEAVAFGGMLLVVLYLTSTKGGVGAALPIVALYAFAGYRLMPALQQIYGSVAQLRFAAPALDKLYDDLVSNSKSYQAVGAVTPPILPVSEIELRDIFFSYPNAPQPTLKQLNLRIPARSVVGLIGTTGSGKTTTVDVILGLLEPTRGVLLVDGTQIGPHNRRQWQSAIGYVPQQVYLADDTIAANIAFGLSAVEIDMSAIERAARIANLHEFVVADLPLGYATIVGERGVRLSGGQRQRIGIARALYHRPQVLILDEATSALDNLTEQAVMEAVQNLGHEITIILIAHRLTTVRQCDQIYLLNGGRVEAHGTYDELMACDDTFRAMTGQDQVKPFVNNH